MLKTYGARWNEIGTDWTRMAEELNVASRANRMFTLIDFDAQGRLVCQGYSPAARLAAQAYLAAV